MPRRDAIEPGIARDLGQLDRLAETAHRIVRARVLRHQERAEFHLSSSRDWIDGVASFETRPSDAPQDEDDL